MVNGCGIKVNNKCSKENTKASHYSGGIYQIWCVYSRHSIRNGAENFKQ
jgi:hypothetical protein